MCLAIPGKIKSIEENKEGFMRTGRVEMGGIIKEINLQLVPDAKLDDYVLVHVGVAISMVDEEEANSTLAYLQQMNELDELYNLTEGEKTINEEKEKRKEEIINKMMDGKK